MQSPTRLALAAALATAFTLAGCGTYSPRDVHPGMSADAVLAAMGPPHARHPQPDGGTRLEYPRGPQGLHTFMVDLDAQGRVTGWQQVLTEANFNAIADGTPVAELQRRLGRPIAVRGGGWQPGQVWTYRFDSWACQWWQVSVVQGRTAGAAYGPDPRCEAPNDPWH